jgi:hypothetical protein
LEATVAPICLTRCCRHRHALDPDGAGQLTLLDDLGTLGSGVHQTGRLQGGKVDDPVTQLVELVQEHLGALVPGTGTEADLGQTALQRHLAALEAGLDLAAAGAGVLALVATAGRLAQAGADAAADPGAFLAGTGGGLDVIQSHGYLLLDPDQVVHLVDQTAHARGVLELAHVVQLAQAQGLDAEAVPLLAAAQAFDQADTDGLAVLSCHR